MHPLRILFVILCVALVYYTASNTSDKSQNLTDKPVASVDSKLSKEKSPTATSGVPNVVNPELMQHDYAHLKDFILPEIYFGNLTPKEAVNSLVEHYQTVCATTGEAPLMFDIKVEGEARGSVLMTMSGSFQDILERIALYSGMELDQHRNAIALHAISPSQKIVSQTFDVPADFEYLVGLSIDEHECTENEAQESSVNAHLAKLMHLSKDTLLSYDVLDAQLKVSGTEDDLYRIGKLVQLTGQQKVVRIHTNTKMFSAPVDMDIPTDTLLSSEDAEQVLVKASEQKEFQQNTTPLLISMNGERTTIANTEEVVAVDEADGSLYHDWKGYRITTSSDLLGFGVQSYVRAENNIPVPNTQKLVFHDKEAEHFLLPSESVIIKTHEADGRSHYLSISKTINGVTSNRLASQ